MRISLLSRGFRNWGGGIDFLRYIASSIAAADDPDLAIQMILPKDYKWFSAKKLKTPAKAALQDIRCGRLPRWRSWQGFSEAYFRNSFQDFSAKIPLCFSSRRFKDEVACAERFGADVLLPCLTEPKNFARAWVGYIPDFQHRHLPHFFSDQEIRHRDADFKRMLQQARHIIVNAHTVVADAQQFMEPFPARLHVLPFSPCPQPAWLEDQRDVRASYGIDRPYFLICNQFWKHKNHTTAFEGYARYRQQGGEALLVCTGETTDYRFPDYFAELQQLLGKLGVKNHVRILGHIPKRDQINFVKHTRAVVQPTLFEGGPGGCAAYDAIALGVPLIVSDIPVNREITVGDVRYFMAEDADALGTEMLASENRPLNRSEPAQLLAQGLARKQQCGTALIAICRQAIRSWQDEH